MTEEWKHTKRPRWLYAVRARCSNDRRRPAVIITAAATVIYRTCSAGGRYRACAAMTTYMRAAGARPML